MPALHKMMAEGMTFNNHFVSDSLCCPSRASILTGMLPHNTGVLSNLTPIGGFSAFNTYGNDQKTFAIPLQAAGYKTAFMGKYLNEYSPRISPQPPGWDEWISTNNGYAGFGYPANRNGVLSNPPEHFTDYISAMGVSWIRTVQQPFFIELSPFSPHGPYTPPARYANSFLGAVMPKGPTYSAVPDAAAPAWLKVITPLTASKKADMDRKFIKRVQASKGVDDMIKAVRRKVADLGLTDNTYVIFTSDNGYHMGEYSLRPGKRTPFDVDIHVPFVIVGPRIPPHSKYDGLTMNIDIYSTLMDLALLPESPTVDGRSILTPIPRNLIVVEQTRPPYDPADPDVAGPNQADPPTYGAIRSKTWLYVEYETGELGYYDLVADPDELHNVIATLSVERKQALHSALLENRTCVGAVECGAAQNLAP